MFSIKNVVIISLLVCSLTFAGSIIKEFQFPPQSINVNYRDGYDFVSLPGCNAYLEELGKPTIPFVNLNVLIPPSAEIKSIEILNSKQTEISGKYFLFPAQLPRPISYQGDMIFTSPDEETYNMSVAYPNKITEIIPSGNKSGFRIGGVFLYPLQYIPKERKLILYEKIKIKINYEEGKYNITELTRSQKNLFQPDVKNLVINPEDIERFSPNERVSDNPDIDYVILTSSSLESRFIPLVTWLRKTGLWAETRTTSWVNSNYPGRDLPEKIRNFIREYYISEGLKYILLAGDVSVVPKRGAYVSNQSYTDSMIPCDLYYADLQYSWDGNQNNIFGDNWTINGRKDTVDLYYDLYIGRWPVQTSSEIDTMIRKLFTYSRNPDTLYQKRILLPAGFIRTDYNEKWSQDSIANLSPVDWTDRVIDMG
jgi:hypothetical protein